MNWFLATTLLLAVELAAAAQTSIFTNSSKPNSSSCDTIRIDPAKDFMGNFNNPCYALALNVSEGQMKSGDLDARYNEVFYHVTPGYDLILLGTFPNARFFSVDVYDSHAAPTSSVLDYAIHPLNSSMINPFHTGMQYLPAQGYGITIGFGSGSPVTVAPGCSTSNIAIDQNVLDASSIHQGITWTGYPNLPPGFPAHQTGANIGGAIMVRSYVDISSEPTPVVIARSLSNGCAILANQAIQQSIVSLQQAQEATWSNPTMISAHKQFANQITPTECYQPDPLTQAQWLRGSAYVPGNNNDAAYVQTAISSSLVSSLISGHQFIRIQFQTPTTPVIPCQNGNCSLTGAEQVRYRSISFQASGLTLASIADTSFVRDPLGNTTLVVGMGTKPPGYVTPANYYTYIDLSKIPKFQGLSAIVERDILPNGSFECSGFNVPFLTMEYNPDGGFMGNYVPTVDYPTASQLPTRPIPIVRTNSCAAIPDRPPQVCGG